MKFLSVRNNNPINYPSKNTFLSKEILIGATETC